MLGCSRDAETEPEHKAWDITPSASFELAPSTEQTTPSRPRRLRRCPFAHHLRQHEDQEAGLGPGRAVGPELAAGVLLRRADQDLDDEDDEHRQGEADRRGGDHAVEGRPGAPSHADQAQVDSPPADWRPPDLR